MTGNLQKASKCKLKQQWDIISHPQRQECGEKKHGNVAVPSPVESVHPLTPNNFPSWYTPWKNSCTYAQRCVLECKLRPRLQERKKYKTPEDKSSERDVGGYRGWTYEKEAKHVNGERIQSVDGAGKTHWMTKINWIPTLHRLQRWDPVELN